MKTGRCTKCGMTGFTCGVEHFDSNFFESEFCGPIVYDEKSETELAEIALENARHDLLEFELESPKFSNAVDLGMSAQDIAKIEPEFEKLSESVIRFGSTLIGGHPYDLLENGVLRKWETPTKRFAYICGVDSGSTDSKSIVVLKDNRSDKILSVMKFKPVSPEKLKQCLQQMYLSWTKANCPGIQRKIDRNTARAIAKNSRRPGRDYRKLIRAEDFRRKFEAGELTLVDEVLDALGERYANGELKIK